MGYARVVTLLVLVAFVSVSQLPADMDLRPGDMLRVTAAQPRWKDGPRREVTGTVLLLDADSIVLVARRHADRVVQARLAEGG